MQFRRYQSTDTDPVKIKCSKDKPADAFAAVHYRNHWFWVDDRDWRYEACVIDHHVFVHDD